MLCSLAGVLAFALWSGAASAQLFGERGLFSGEPEAPEPRSEEEIGVPVPVSGEVEALKGHEVTFEIEANSKTPGTTVEFLVRSFPTAGKIVSLVSKPNQRNKAIVTYYANPGSGAEKDAFTFAARYRGGRYSSAARFDIDLVDRKAEIQVPESVDFGEVLIGEETEQEIEVRNLGDGRFDRQLTLASPWRLVDPSDGKLSLSPKGAKTLTVAFQPQRTGETSYFLSLSRSKAGTVKLLGKGREPFSVATEEVQLKLDPDSNERRGEIELVNHGKKPLRLQARASSRLENSLEEVYYVPGESSRRVEVHLGRTDTAPFDGLVQFSLENGYAKSAKVIAPVVPARLEVSIPGNISSEVLNFGQIEAGRSTERKVTITNRGGEAMPLEFHVPEPFRLLNDPGPRLAPLASVDLALGLFPPAKQRGALDVTMGISGKDQTASVRLLANVVRSGRTDGSRARVTGREAASPLDRLRLRAEPDDGSTSDDPESAGSSAVGVNITAAREQAPSVGNGRAGSSNSRPILGSEEAEPGESPLGFATRPLVERKFDRSLKRPEDLSVIESDSDSLTIGWTAPKESGDLGFEVEMRGMAVNAETQMPESVWVPYERVKFDRIDRLAKAKIEGLAPKAQYEFRVFTVDGNGRSSAPSDAMVAETELPMDWTYIYAGLGLGCLVLLGLGVRKVIRDRRSDVYQARYVDA